MIGWPIRVVAAVIGDEPLPASGGARFLADPQVLSIPQVHTDCCRRGHRQIRLWPDPEAWGVRNMATYIGFHEVTDVDHWLHSPKRQELFGPLGITGQLFTDPAKSNRVGLILNVPDMEAFQKLLQSQAGADAMKFDGVHPETMVVLEKASDHV